MLTLRGCIGGVAKGAMLIACAFGASSAWAQDKAPIRLLVGFAGGGVVDSVARIVAEGLRQELDRTVIVENRPGAGGRIAALALAGAPADGTTFLTAPDAWAVGQTITTPPAELRYDILKDFVAVGRLVTFPPALVVGESADSKTFEEYAAWLKASPEQAFVGTAGVKGKLEILGAMMGDALGVPITHVPYKGNAPLAVDLLGGQVPAALMVAGDALKLNNGKLHVLGLLTENRWELAPDVPTLKELDPAMPAVRSSWQGVWARSDTPAPLLAEMEQALQKVLASPKVRESISRDAFVSPNFASGVEMQAELQAELDFWTPVMREAGYVPEVAKP